MKIDHKLIEQINVELEKFGKGNNAAGVRARLLLSILAKQATALRADIISKRKERNQAKA